MNKHWRSFRNVLFAVPCIAFALSYFTQLSLLFSGICLCIVVAIAQLIHLPEDMPGGYDNPNGEELHPKWIILTALVFSVILYFLGWTFPSLEEYLAFGS